MLNSYSPERKAGHIWQYRLAKDGLRVLVLPEGERLFAAACRFYLLDPDTGNIIRKEKEHQIPPTPLVEFAPRATAFVKLMPTDNWLVHQKDEEIILLEPESGKVLEFTPKIQSKKGEVFVSPDGNTALGGPVEGKIRFYDLPDLKLRAEWNGSEDRKIAGFTPDSKDLIVWDKKKTGWALELWSVAGLTRQTILEDDHKPGTVIFSPNRKSFAYLPEDTDFRKGEWEIINVETGKKLFSLPFVSTRGYPQFDSDGNTLWTIRWERFIVPYDVMTGKPKANGPTLTGPVKRFRFSSEEKLVGLCDEAVITWNAANGKEVSRVALPQARDMDSGEAFSPSGDRLVYTDQKGSIISWNPETGVERKTDVKRSDHKPEDTSDQLTTDGRLHISRNSGKMTLLDPQEGKILLERSVPEDWRPREKESPMTVRAVSPDGKWLAATRHNYPNPSPISLFSLADPKADATVLEIDHPLSTFAISPNSRFLVATGEKETPIDRGFQRTRSITIWDLKSSEKSQTLPITCWGVLSTRFSPDGTLLAVHCDDRMLLLDTKTWTVKAKIWTARRNYLASLPSEEEGDTLAWSPSGRSLAVKLGDERIAVWDVARMLGK